MNVGNFVVENLPYITAAGGAVVSAGTEAFAIRHAAANRVALSAYLEGVNPAQNEQHSRRHRVGNAVAGVALFAVAGLGLGLANGMAWQPADSEGVLPYLGIAVDHSGATSTHEPKSIDGINQVVDGVGNLDGVEAVAQVAALGTVTRENVDDVAKLDPSGHAPLDQAFSRITGTIEERWTKTIGTKKNKAGILIVTNGNGIGDPTQATETAKRLGVPVFIANVEGEAVSPDTTEQLKAISTQTGGQYWPVNKGNIDKMTKKISDTLEEGDMTNPQPTKWPKRIIAGLSTIGFLGLGFRKRSQMTLTQE